MQISREQLAELRELIEDTAEYFCDENKLSIRRQRQMCIRDRSHHGGSSLMKDSRGLADLFMHFVRQLIIEHEADNPQELYQLVADRSQAEANRLMALDPARNR